MKFIRHIPYWLKNRYLLTTLCFVAWLSFFDDRDLISNFRHRNELKQLEISKEYYQKQIEETRRELELFNHDPAFLEKFAREKYRMKKDNEDLYIVAE